MRKLSISFHLFAEKTFFLESSVLYWHYKFVTFMDFYTIEYRSFTMNYGKKKKYIRILSAALALCLLVPGQAMAETIDEVKEKQEALRQENEALEAKLEVLKDDEAKALEYQKTLEEKIGVLEKKIDAARESILVMDREIGF